MSAGVILAAGRSSRFGSPKALFEIEGQSMLGRLARVFVEAGLDPVIVVASGPTLDHARLLAGVEVIEGDPAQAMIESLSRAIARLDGATGAVVQPVDAPFTTVEMISAVRGGDRSRVLAHHGVWGHPVYLGRRSFDAVRARPDGGLRAVLEAEPAEVVEWADARVLADVDTIEDLM